MYGKGKQLTKGVGACGNGDELLVSNPVLLYE